MGTLRRLAGWTLALLLCATSAFATETAPEGPAVSVSPTDRLPIEQGGIEPTVTVEPLMVAVGGLTTAATQAALAALDVTGESDGALVDLLGRVSSFDGAGGLVAWNSADLSTEVAADSLAGVYIPPASDPTGAGGAWVRQYTGPVDPRWFGAVADYDVGADTGTDNAAAFAAAFTFGQVIIPATPLAFGSGDVTIGNDLDLLIEGDLALTGVVTHTTGGSRVLIHGPGTVHQRQAEVAAAIQLDGLDEAAIDGITLRNASRGLRFGGTAVVRVTGVTIEQRADWNSIGSPINAVVGTTFVARDNIVHLMDVSALPVNSPSGIAPDQFNTVVVAGNVVTGGYTGIVVRDCVDVVLTGNHLDGQKTAPGSVSQGVYLRGYTQASLSGNRATDQGYTAYALVPGTVIPSAGPANLVENLAQMTTAQTPNASWGILSRQQGGSIAGNTVAGAFTFGMQLTGASRVGIFGNAVDVSGPRGILLSNSDHNLVTPQPIRATGASSIGVYLFGTSTGNIVYSGDQIAATTPTRDVSSGSNSILPPSLAVGGNISGRVTAEADGSPLIDVLVEACSDIVGCRDTRTDGSGGYLLEGLSAGVYRVEVLEPPSPYVREYYDNALDRADTVPVLVAEAADTADIDFSLAVGGSITGQVFSDADGLPLAAAEVSACSEVRCEGGMTDGNGVYVISNLYPGAYRVAVGQSYPYIGEYFDNSQTYAQATLVNVASGDQSTGIDFGLAPIDSDQDGLNDLEEQALGTDPNHPDTDGDGAWDGGDSTPLTVNANLAWAGVQHVAGGDGSAVDRLDVGIRMADNTGLGDLRASVTGPNGFTHSFSNLEAHAYLPGQLGLWADFDSLNPLTPGLYTFTVTDRVGGSVSQTDLHLAPQAVPSVAGPTIQYQRLPNGDYHFSWTPVDAPRLYYYRFRIFDSPTAGVPVYSGARSPDTWEDVPADSLQAGVTYFAVVETHDAPTFDLLKNRSNSVRVAFLHQAVVDDPDPVILHYARVVNFKPANGSHQAGLNFFVSVPTAVTAASVAGPDFAYSFDLVADRSGSEFWKSVDTALTPGPYTFSVTVDGLTHTRYDYLTDWVDYPLPNPATYQVEDLGSGNLRFSWAPVEQPGPLWYRVRVINTDNGKIYNSARTDQAQLLLSAAAIEASVEAGNWQWLVCLFDSSDWSTTRTLVNGPSADYSTIPPDPSRPQISPLVSHRITGTGSDQVFYWTDISDLENDLLSLAVTGPVGSGIAFDLLQTGTPYRGLGYQGVLRKEPGLPPAGLYTFVATDAEGRRQIRYDYQSPPVAYSAIDARTLHVDSLADGQLRISWAPVAADGPLYYRVEFLTLTDHNGDSYPDETLLSPYQNFTAWTFNPAQLPNEELVLRLRARETSGGTAWNNRTHSIYVGYQGPGFDYSSLADQDQDGWASNIDANDNDPKVYPLAPASAVTTVGLVQAAAGGGSIDFVASADGGAPEYLFKFRSAAGAWATVRGYAPGATWNVDPAQYSPGTYYVMVYARTQGSTASYQAAKASGFTIIPPAEPVTTVGLVQAAAGGGTIDFVASADGSAPEYLFKFRSAAGAWATVRGYATGATWNVDPAQYSPGTYYVMVYARTQGSTASYQAAKALGFTNIPPAEPVTTVGLVQGAAGDGTIDFVASADGGAPEYLFKFRSAAGAWATVRGYAPGATWNVDPAQYPPGTYYVMVYARTQGSTASYQAAKALALVAAP